MAAEEAEEQRRRNLLTQHLRANFGDIGNDTLRVLRDNMDWIDLRAGDVLMTQGEPGDAVYVTLSGRLRVYVADDTGQRRLVRELGRGEITGEMSLYSGAPRSATVVAIRDTLVARLEKDRFHQLLTQSPQVSLAMTQKVIERLQTQHRHVGVPAPVMVTLQPITDGIDARDFALRLCAALRQHGRVCWVDEAGLRTLAPQPNPNGDVHESLALALDTLEADHDFVLLLADPAPTAWTRLCCSHSDEVLLLAHAEQPARLHPVEVDVLCDTDRLSEAAETLVLMHPDTTRCPMGMARWLDRRPVTSHINLRPGLERDMARLARLLSRNAVGLVLAGGGARGFAHLGIWKVLRQQGIEIDCVGGTSMGAVMAAIIAADAETRDTLDVARRAFRINPTGDYNWLPLISLIKGQRVRSVIRQSIKELMGGPVDIVDLWKGYFCVASNYTQGHEVRFHRGDLGRSLLSSIAIPGALPPVVHDGDLLCDGGTFNNFPTDAMREMRGVGRVIGIDLSARQPRRVAFDEVPGTWTLLLDKLRPRRLRRYKLPSLVSYLLNVTILYSTSRQNEARRQADLYFNPPLFRVGLLQWSRFEAILRQGETHAHEVLEQLKPEERARWGIAP